MANEGLIEYTILASVIAVLAILALTFIGGRLEKLFEQYEYAEKEIACNGAPFIFPSTSFGLGD